MTDREPLRTVHVGVRGRGRWALDLMTQDGRFEPVGAVSREPATLVDEIDVPVFGDLPAALDGVVCDAVVVCTPVELHARDLRIAFAAGRHVLVEKCLSNDWIEAKQLVAEAEAAGVELVVAQNLRYEPWARTLRLAVEGGRFGTPMLIDVALHKYRPAPRQQDYPYAAFWDQGCHHVDLLQSVFGPVAEAQATTFTAPWSRYRDDAGIQALLRFESGAVWTYLLSNLARTFEHRFLVQSAEGALSLVDGQWRWSAGAAGDDDAFGWNDPPVEVAGSAGPAAGEQGVLDAFARAVSTRAPTEISGRANLETLRVCEMVRRAGTSGRTVRRDEVD